MTVSFASFSGLAAGAWLEVAVASFSPVSPWGQGNWQVTDFTTPMVSGASVPLSSSLPTVIIATVYVPANTCGRTTYNTNFVLTPQGGSVVNIPVSLYVFDVVLSVEPHLATNGESQPRFRTGTGPLYNDSQLDAMYLVYGQHRQSGRSQSWPAGLNWQVSWDSTNHKLVDMDGTTSTNACLWSNGCDYKRYVLGQSGVWRGVPYTAPKGAPAAQSESCSTDGGRPQTFDGQACNTAASGWTGSQWSGWMCSPSYEAAWGNYMQQLVTWLSANVPNYTQSLHGQWYTINEPQNWDDYTKGAYLCMQAKTRAPGLKVSISREADPWFYNRADGLSCGYDVWVGHLNRLNVYRTWNRQKLGEHSFVYFLDSDAGCAPSGSGGLPGIRCSPHLAPYISATGNNGAENPSATNDGMHYRAIPWVLFALRVEGWLYYKDGGTTLWDDSKMDSPNNYQPPRPRVAAMLLREGLEDYELLYQANCNSKPVVFKKSQVDDTVLSIGALFASFRQTPNAEDEHAQLRIELGKYLEGTRADLPSLVTPFMFPFGNVFFDFVADPGTNTPFAFNNSQWIPVDFNNNYDVAKGFGFQSKQLGVPNWLQPSTVWILQCVDTGNGDVVTRTVCFNNFNAANDQFVVNVAPGTYTVTVGVGFSNDASNPRNGDEEYVEVNDVVLRNASCSAAPGTCFGVREYSATVTVGPSATGGSLFMTFGSPYKANYVALSYLKLVAVGNAAPITSQPTCGRPIAPACVAGGTTAAGQTTPAPTTPAPTTPAPTTPATSTPAPTTVAGATTAAGSTTAVGATSAPQATTTPQATTVAGATTRATTVPQATTATAAPATTTAGAGGTSSPGTANCIWDVGPTPQGWQLSRLVLNRDFALFDCEAFRSVLANDMGLVTSQIRIITAVAGSVILGFESPIFASNSFANRVASGNSQIPGLASFTLASGQTVTPPGFPWQIVVGVVLGVLALVAIAIIIVCIVKQRRGKSYSSDYASTDYHRVGSTTTVTHVSASAYAPPPAAVAAASGLVAFSVIADVVDVGDSVLPAKRGNIAFMSVEDTQQTSDWAWVKIGTAEGFVPRQFLARK